MCIRTSPPSLLNSGYCTEVWWLSELHRTSIHPAWVLRKLALRARPDVPETEDLYLGYLPSLEAQSLSRDLVLLLKKKNIRRTHKSGPKTCITTGKFCETFLMVVVNYLT